MVKKHILHVLLERHQSVIASDGFGCSCANRSELKEFMQFLKQSKQKLFPWYNQVWKGGLVSVHAQLHDVGPFLSLFCIQWGMDLEEEEHF